jgi:hypothetical protein
MPQFQIMPRSFWPHVTLVLMISNGYIDQLNASSVKLVPTDRLYLLISSICAVRLFVFGGPVKQNPATSSFVSPFKGNTIALSYVTILIPLSFRTSFLFNYLTNFDHNMCLFSPYPSKLSKIIFQFRVIVQNCAMTMCLNMTFATVVR